MNEFNISFTTEHAELDEAKVEKFCQHVLEILNIDNWEVSIVFCDDEFIRSLNKQYKGKDAPTDVLSFSQSEGEEPEVGIDTAYDKIIAGDIVISLDTVKVNAKNLQIPLEEELKRLLIHGLLHLNGMEHTGATLTAEKEENQASSEMLQLQEDILKKLYEEKLF